MAISIASSSVLGAGAGLEYPRLPAAGARAVPGAREASEDSSEFAGTGSTAEARPARQREILPGRVERISAGESSPALSRGIQTYLNIEYGAVVDSVGGELVGIDFYV